MFDEALVAGPSIIPHSVAVRRNWKYARTIQNALLKRRESSCRIAQHLHGLHCSECFGSIISHMLIEEELAIEVETQVLPVGLVEFDSVTSLYSLSISFYF